MVTGLLMKSSIPFSKHLPRPRGKAFGRERDHRHSTVVYLRRFLLAQARVNS